MRPTPRAGSAVAAAVLAAVAAPAAATAQVIVGRVIDAASGVAVARAIVTADGPSSRRTLSGDDGRFSIRLDSAGSYRVRVTRQGYRAAPGTTVSVGPGDTVAVDARVTGMAVALRALDVTARKRPLEVTGRFRPKRRAGSAPVAPVRAEGRRRAVAVQGTFATPNLCYDLAAAADRTGPVVTLVVEARSGGGYRCARAAGALTYSVALREVPSGSYAVRVFHAVRDRGGEREMTLDTTVAVR